MKNKIHMLIYAAVGLPAAAVRWVRNIGRETVTACNAFTPAQHKNSKTQFSKVAITTRYLLGKFSTNAADAAAGVVVITGQGDRALFIIADTVSSTDLSYDGTYAPVECLMIGSINKTVPMIANAALTVGTVVYPDTGGTVNTYAGAGSGTAYSCGVVVGQPSAQAGDIVEVEPLLSTAASTT